MSSHAHPILIRDEGDLHEVRSLLTEFGVDYADAGTQDPGVMPTHMLISSGSRAVSALEQIESRAHSHHFLHVIVTDRASRSLRAMLERRGCDMVLQRPVHPTVLRLLTQRALYPGKEKRLDDRVAIGAEIKLKSGLFSRAATLAELSARGCGLITKQSCSVGSELKLTLPRTLTGEGPLTLVSKVVGSHSGSKESGGRNSVAVVFTKVTASTRRMLQKIMKSHAAGPTGRLDATPGTPTAHAMLAQHSQPPAATKAPSERRSAPRGEYTQPVLARSSGVSHSLIGRDLSLGGMRVEFEPGLAVGEQIHLAIYGNAGVPPVIVGAEVVREDDGSGLGLSFGPLTKTAQTSIEDIVSSLEALGAGSSGTVMSEVLEAG